MSTEPNEFALESMQVYIANLADPKNGWMVWRETMVSNPRSPLLENLVRVIVNTSGAAGNREWDYDTKAMAGVGGARAIWSEWKVNLGYVLEKLEHAGLPIAKLRPELIDSVMICAEDNLYPTPEGCADPFPYQLLDNPKFAVATRYGEEGVGISVGNAFQAFHSECTGANRRMIQGLRFAVTAHLVAATKDNPEQFMDEIAASVKRQALNARSGGFEKHRSTHPRINQRGLGDLPPH